jgi:2-polyprenyl-6-methoxyphenol hydroxylase-like FAD-dependent oxidoreductase
MGLCDVLRSFVDNPGEERDVRDGEGEREGVVRYRKVVEVREGEDRRPGVAFEDGSVESADLVVGADGVRSVVKKGIFGETNPPVYM